MVRFLFSRALLFVILFAFAFGINFGWEIFHARWYQFLPPMTPTAAHLALMALKDAFWVVIFSFVVGFFVRDHHWLLKNNRAGFAALALVGGIFAFFIELHALRTGRWAYLPAMPLVGSIGVSPLLQMSVGSALAAFMTLRLHMISRGIVRKKFPSPTEEV